MHAPSTAMPKTNVQKQARTKRFVTDEARWAAVLKRDHSADGHFYYAVRTTGVYCRPSCASRTARRENVTFYRDGNAAEQAGFRACKRCKPDEAALSKQQQEKILAACHSIETSVELPTLDELARAAGMSRFHFHRLFKAIAGLTPKAYAVAHRGRRVRSRLEHANQITHAIYDSGFNSAGRFYAASDRLLGMTPTQFRQRGMNTRIRFAVGECSLGSILVAATDKGVCAILLGDDPDALLRDLQDRFARAELIGGDGDFEKTVAAVIAFVETPSQELDVQLDIHGTVFQERVWRALQKIPPGATVSYSELATRLGSPKATRAVAQACASNAIAIAIPCHRVVRNDGSLSGYRWGVERKRQLLERERNLKQKT